MLPTILKQYLLFYWLSGQKPKKQNNIQTWHVCHSPALWPTETWLMKLWSARINQCFRSNKVLHDSPTSSLKHCREKKKKFKKEMGLAGRTAPKPCNSYFVLLNAVMTAYRLYFYLWSYQGLKSGDFSYITMNPGFHFFFFTYCIFKLGTDSLKRLHKGKIVHSSKLTTI